MTQHCPLAQVLCLSLFLISYVFYRIKFKIVGCSLFSFLVLVMDARAIEGAGGASVDSRVTTEWSQVQVPGLRQSISMNDFLALLSDPASGDNPELEEMKQLLLSDNNTQPETTSDEKSVMSKVNSFYNLLQAAANDDLDIGAVDVNNRPKTECNDRVVDPASSSKPQGMSRKDSFSDLLVHLPRITSLPKFLFNISE